MNRDRCGRRRAAMNDSKRDRCVGVRHGDGQRNFGGWTKDGGALAVAVVAVAVVAGFADDDRWYWCRDDDRRNFVDRWMVVAVRTAWADGATFGTLGCAAADTIVVTCWSRANAAAVDSDYCRDRHRIVGSFVRRSRTLAAADDGTLAVVAGTVWWAASGCSKWAFDRDRSQTYCKWPSQMHSDFWMKLSRTRATSGCLIGVADVVAVGVEPVALRSCYCGDDLMWR